MLNLIAIPSLLSEPDMTINGQTQTGRQTHTQRDYLASSMLNIFKVFMTLKIKRKKQNKCMIRNVAEHKRTESCHSTVLHYLVLIPCRAMKTLKIKRKKQNKCTIQNVAEHKRTESCHSTVALLSLNTL